MTTTINISEPLTLESVSKFITQNQKVTIDQQAFDAIKKCNDYLLQKISVKGSVFYGINTGFGALCDTQISSGDLLKLQENLLMSHACGMGEQVPDDVVKLMLLFKIKSLSLGYSGVKNDTVQRLTDFLNLGLFPLVYKQGSLGASGDLAPLAHLCLPLIGKGKIGNKPSLEVLTNNNLKPIVLGPKEGLALINGTQFMTAYGIYSLLLAKKLSRWADRIAAISLEAFDCHTQPFFPQIHEVRKQKGQIDVAKNILELLADSHIMNGEKDSVQDPYSFRCIPQVHGATRDVITQVETIFINEINAVTDNPNIFVDDDLIISGGNFHGQVLALHADFLAMGIAELGSISERRIYKLISGERGLPVFLTPNPGLNSGFMIPQYTAASVVSLNKQLCTPASVDSIVSSNGQEDHVSMGANAVLKLIRVVENVRKVLAIELFTACQALEFRDIKQSSPASQKLLKSVREKIPFIKEDMEMAGFMAEAERILDKE
ncbi:MAG: histidine ammonia-lyase [Bacteroidia bacterium]